MGPTIRDWIYQGRRTLSFGGRDQGAGVLACQFEKVICQSELPGGLCPTFAAAKT